MSTLPKCYGVIPSRYKSTRLPGKPLADIHGKPMFWHVYQRAAACPYFEKVVIATESELIMEAATQYNIPCIMTSDQHTSGTDRVLEAARILGVADDAVVANIQGDEPAIHPEMMNELLEPFADPKVQVSTLAHLITKEEAQNPNRVKVALTHDRTALYFSRSPIPYDRENTGPLYYNHIGLYAFRMPVLKQFPTLPQSDLEKAECLEQLRLMQVKIPIHVSITRHKNASVDVPADLEIVKGLISPEDYK